MHFLFFQLRFLQVAMALLFYSAVVGSIWTSFSRSFLTAADSPTSNSHSCSSIDIHTLFMTPSSQ